MHRPLLVAAAAALIALPASADTLVQWNFNSVTPDANAGTGTVVPAIGTGTASLVGGTTATFASGDASGGSSDPATGDDSGWNVTTFPAQGSGDKTRGAAFATSTVGFENVVFSFDLRHSNTSSRYEAVQYTLNGSTWLDAIVFDANEGGDRWYNGRTVDLSDVAGVADNASFAVRVLATFAPGTSAYAATAPGSSYGTSGTWRFDMVTIAGTPIAPIPEPGSTALLLAGLGTLGFLARRRG
jgi:PEP-CTERM motif